MIHYTTAEVIKNTILDSVNKEVFHLDHLVHNHVIKTDGLLHEMEWSLAESLTKDMEEYEIFMLIGGIAKRYPGHMSDDPLRYPFDLGTFLDKMQKVVDSTDDADFSDAMRQYATDMLWMVIDKKLADLKTRDTFEQAEEKTA